MWKSLWITLSNERGQEPSSPATEESSGTTEPVVNERAAEDDSYGVRAPYDSNTPDPADSTPSASPEQTSTQQTQEEPYFTPELNLDPSTFSPENQEVFKRMQAAHTKKMQRFKGYEGHLQNMERFYNDREFAEQTLRSWAAKQGLAIVPQQFNNQPAQTQPPAGVNPLQAKIVERMKAKLPAETQWMADGQAAAIFDVMQEVLGPVLSEFQGFKTAKEEHEWKALESQYDDAETKFAEKHPGWEVHEDEMSQLQAFMSDPKQYVHPVFGSKHEILFNAITRNANAVKEATARMTAAQKNKTPTAAPVRRSTGSGFTNIQDEVAAIPDKGDAFARAAQHALQQLKRRR